VQTENREEETDDNQALIFSRKQGRKKKLELFSEKRAKEPRNRSDFQGSDFWTNKPTKQGTDTPNRNFRKKLDFQRFRSRSH
jgi:hypothetical protein